MNQQEMNERIMNCQQCPKGTIELGWGTVGKIMFIGQCPAFSNITGAQGTSKFDTFFFSLLSDLKLTEEDFYFTNLVKVPIDMTSLTQEQMKHCGTHLLEEIETVKPTLIITLGKYAREWARANKVESENLIHPGAMRYGMTTPEKWTKKLKLILQRHGKIEL